VRRDSGPAVAATLAAQRDPETIVAVFAADHVVTDVPAYSRRLKTDCVGAIASVAS